MNENNSVIWFLYLHEWNGLLYCAPYYILSVTYGTDWTLQWQQEEKKKTTRAILDNLFLSLLYSISILFNMVCDVWNVSFAYVLLWYFPNGIFDWLLQKFQLHYAAKKKAHPVCSIEYWWWIWMWNKVTFCWIFSYLRIFVV